MKNRKFQILGIPVMHKLEKECFEMFDFGKWGTTELSDPWDSNSSYFNSESPAIEFMLSPSVEFCEKHGALLDIFDPTVELP